MARAKVDFQIVNHGTIYLLYPNTRRAKQWVKDNLPQDHMKYADASVVEHRYIGDIIEVDGGHRVSDLLRQSPLTELRVA
jgi:hypothetical protein